MKRMHVHLSVQDLNASVRFYSTLFAATPTVLKTDYAKWMLDDPRVNFAYAKSEKSWVEDPQGIRWETFLTTGESTLYGNEAPSSGAACCVPSKAATQATAAGSCCAPEDRTRARAGQAACCG